MAVAYALPSEALRRKAEREIVGALDRAPFTRRHVIFTAAILASLFFDYGKPIALSFVIPGMRAMWNLSPQTGSLLAVFGLTGTTIGAITWGVLSDRIGRRATLLWTVGIFSVASLCGLALEYWNSLVACLIMGFGVGAEVPAVLASEYIPAKYRGRTLLFLGLAGWLGGYAFTAGLSAIFHSFLPIHSAWRFIWLANILPGLLILWLRRRVIPESARFLLHHGRIEEARTAAESMVGPIPDVPPAETEEKAEEPMGALSSQKLFGRAAVAGFYALTVGFATFGFVVWLPTLLTGLGFTSSGSSAYLLLSALIALPALAITLPVLHRLGPRRTLIGYALGAGLALFAMSLGVARGAPAPVFLVLTISLVLFFIFSISGLLSLYAVEIFPTGMRGRFSGIIAALGRVGAVSGPFLVGVWLTRGGSIPGLQLGLAAFLGAAAVVLIVLRIETHGRTLEQI